MNIEEKIRKLSELFEWLDPGRGFIQSTDHDLYTHVSLMAQNPSWFAPCAKAEMARRGWEWESITNTVGGYANMSLGIPHPAPSTCEGWAVQVPDVGGFEFDPTKKDSEAEAIIDACLEALEVES